MSRDYKDNELRNGARGNGSLLIGILIGVVLGLAIALAVAWYINKMPNPFQRRAPVNPSETVQPLAEPASKSADTKGKGADAKPRFDFYKILPGVEEPATDQQLVEARKSAGKSRESFYLQAGAFQSAAEADSLKARLALIGTQALVQTTTLPDRGVWHRVRIGPYTDVEELNRTRDTLKKSGIDTTLIKVRDGDK